MSDQILELPLTMVSFRRVPGYKNPQMQILRRPSKKLLFGWRCYPKIFEIYKAHSKSSLLQSLLPFSVDYDPTNYTMIGMRDGQARCGPMTLGSALEWNPRSTERAWLMATMGAGGFFFHGFDSRTRPPLGRERSGESPPEGAFVRVNDTIMGIRFYNERKDIYPKSPEEFKGPVFRYKYIHNWDKIKPCRRWRDNRRTRL